MFAPDRPAMAAATELSATLASMKRSEFDSKARLESLQASVRAREKLLESLLANRTELNERLKDLRSQFAEAEATKSSRKEFVAAQMAEAVVQFQQGKKLASAAVSMRPATAAHPPTPTGQALTNAWNVLLRSHGSDGIVE